MKLRTRMLVLLIGAVFVIFGSVSAYNIYNTSQMNRDNAKEMLKSDAENISKDLQLSVETALTSARSMAHALQGMKEIQATDRETVNAMLYSLVKDNQAFEGAWTIWEPNAFDGKDKEYVNTELHDETGRFIPYFYRSADNQIVGDLSVNYDNPEDAPYYFEPMEKGHEVIIEPYLYEVNGEEKMF
ncbi:cache domain-containing protein [Metabacillus malikii]|uniref:Methyl-accepting chemotaxis protein n=1 Tax=Metabacillus malikii TaxID=1504265 RepID=A0ABT9ZCU6_9BACI|nr:cache domain-containing protein [Metabacillus malikii]MDQ0229085.1 hypothetical protein [Metabacillus malikii]